MSEFIKLYLYNCLTTGFIVGSLFTKNYHDKYQWVTNVLVTALLWFVIKTVGVYLYNKYKSKKYGVTSYISGEQRRIIITDLPKETVRNECLLILNKSNAKLINANEDYCHTLKSVFNANETYPGERVDISFDEYSNNKTKITIDSFHLLDNVKIDFGRCSSNIEKFTSVLSELEAQNAA